MSGFRARYFMHFAALKRRLLQVGVFLGLISALTLGACQVYPFIPDHYTFTRVEAQGALDRKFPFRKRYGQLVSIDLSHPVLMLHPESNSVSIAMNAEFDSPLLQQPVTGGFALNSQLEYDIARHAVVLKQPTLEHLDLTQVPGVDARQLNAIASVAATELLEHYPVYVFKPEQLAFGGVHYRPGEIRVEPNGIRVQIVEQQ
jgi:hypothetical protein